MDQTFCHIKNRPCYRDDCIPGTFCAMYEKPADEATRRIRRLAKEGKVEFAETEEVEKYEQVIYEFLDTVLSIKRAFVSDESNLSDFVDHAHGRQDRAETAILARANKIYSLGLTTAHIRLTEIAKQIIAKRSPI